MALGVIPDVELNGQSIYWWSLEPLTGYSNVGLLIQLTVILRTPRWSWSRFLFTQVYLELVYHLSEF